MQNPSKHRHALLALAIVLASSLISGQTLGEVRAADSSGTLDPAFGTDGKVTTDFTGFRGIAHVQPNGKIVAAGGRFLTRYNGDGTLDGSFGSGGIVTNDAFQAIAVTVQPDGTIVTAGEASINGSIDFALARYNSDGTLDAGFGTGGTVTTDFAGPRDRAFSVVVQPDGKIVAAGQATGQGGFDFALVRYNRDGSLDTSFGTGGTVTTSVGNGSFDFAFAVALQPNGKIVAAGSAIVGGSVHFALARYD